MQIAIGSDRAGCQDGERGGQWETNRLSEAHNR
jgi:hypothetical protein